MQWKMLKLILVCVLGSCLLWAEGEEKSTDNRLLQATTHTELIALKQEFIKQVTTWEQDAIDILNTQQTNDNNPDRRFAAIAILARLRSEKAVIPLIKNIKLRPRYITSDGEEQPGIGDIYPAAHALVQIGKPSIKECLGALKKAKAEKMIFSWIVEQIEGKDMAGILISKSKSANKE